MPDPATVLIVDDDRVSRSVAVLALQDAGDFRILEAANAAEGMSTAEQEHPVLIITDHYMPGEDGIVFCQKIKARPELADTMVMMLTSASETKLKVRGFDRGADEYMTKPFDPAEFASRVRALLRLKSLQEELKRDNAELERLNQSVSQNLDGVLNLLVHIVGLRVPNASNRSDKACDLCRWVGSRLNLKPDDLNALVIAARVHEIGKIVMPDELLSKKEGSLEAEDRDALAQFPIFGQMLVGKIPQLKSVGYAIRHQMENYDGTGIPDKLMRQEIPISSRILRVVNFLEEQTIRGDDGKKELIGLLHQHRGTLLDPEVVQLVDEYVRVVEDPSWLEGKRQIAVTDLHEGMTLAGDLCTANGTKLLPQGSRLTSSHVERVLEHHRLDPIINAVYIYEPGGAGNG